MTARERLHAALVLLHRPTDADRLIADRDAEQLHEAADLFQSYGRSFFDGGILSGHAAAELLRQFAATRGVDTSVSSSITAAVGESTRSETTAGAWVVEARIGASDWKRVAGPYDRTEAGQALTEYAHWYPADQVRLTPTPVGVGGSATGDCRTKGCGQPEDEVDGSDPAIWGWICLHVGGTDTPLSWYCSLPCAHAAITRRGAELAADDQAAVLADARGGEVR